MRTYHSNMARRCLPTPLQHRREPGTGDLPFGKPFLYEEELRSKNARLVELDTLLNIDGKGQAHAEAVVAKSTRTSVLDSLKRPVTPRSTDKKPKQHEEVR